MSNSFDVHKMADALFAKSEDSRELITYQIESSSHSDDLLFTNLEGEKLGDYSNGIFTISSSDWQEVILRNRNSIIDQVNLDITALSIEPTVSLFAKSDVKTIQITPIPIINFSPQISLNTPSQEQKGGSLTDLSIIIENQNPVKSNIYEIPAKRPPSANTQRKSL